MIDLLTNKVFSKLTSEYQNETFFGQTTRVRVAWQKVNSESFFL